ncbi:MAG: gamma-glutamyl-gamma-aminobutyrate hydrolase family protein [Acidimicrobiia bacterium]|nr:gamma-glutamyl-gamma-aminobutyrate hydrolase family protein [Acidimicrobiia bacterium]MDH4306714.1 gamma-glutamyl-gamma-aminobutyrate hydrolase family protein [Acidimicrobiia bacterium]MDH5292683.1 gamma-glutamyl-gamma-aminobutyrate hydrolase family protein [Acidimicrobiia bacterium]
MSRPLIGISAWRRTLATSLGTGHHHTIAADNTTALEACGAAVVVLPTQSPEAAEAAVSRLDGVVISGGGDVDPATYGHENSRSSETDPGRDRWEMALIAAARRASRPVFGICRGIQIVNVAFGGTLDQHVWGTDHHPHLIVSEAGEIVGADHTVELRNPSRLHDAFGRDTIVVNSYHHQAVDTVGDGLIVTATSPDGVVEAVESDDGLVTAVQWHPELLDSDHHGALYRAALSIT